MNKTPRKPRPMRPYYTGRQDYLGRTRADRMNTGRECQECFVFGAHAPNCDKTK